LRIGGFFSPDAGIGGYGSMAVVADVVNRGSAGYKPKAPMRRGRVGVIVLEGDRVAEAILTVCCSPA
jgi:hypothetical protein